MIAKILEYVKNQCKDTYFIIGGFIVIWLSAWLSNGLLGTKLDIAALTNFFYGILAKLGIDSIWNSEKGSKP